jgi:hypothetical protein
MDAVSTIEAGALLGPAGIDRVRQRVAEGHRAVWLDDGMLMLLGADTAERLLTAPEVAAPVAIPAASTSLGPPASSSLSAAGPPATAWHESTFAGYTNLPVRLTVDPA